MKIQIKCESNPNEYTTFKLYLKIKNKKENITQKKTLNVLYIEDTQTFIILMKKYMKDFQNCNLYTASCGKDGLDIINNKDIDILILDIGLPDISGFEIIDKIKHKNLKILVLSASIRNSDVDILYKKGITQYLHKPFIKKDFENILKPIINSLIS